MIYYQLLYSYQPQRPPAPGEDDKRSWWKWSFLESSQRDEHLETFRLAIHEAYAHEIEIAVQGPVPEEVMSAQPYPKQPTRWEPTSRVHRGALPKGSRRTFASVAQLELEKSKREPARGQCGRWSKAKRAHDR